MNFNKARKAKNKNSIISFHAYKSFLALCNTSSTAFAQYEPILGRPRVECVTKKKVY